MDEGGVFSPRSPAPKKTVREILRSRPDSEHEQALVRIGAGGVVSLFAILDPECTSLSPHGVYGLALVFLAGSLLIFLDILRNPASSPPRRIAGLLFDTGFTTFFLLYSRASGIPLVVLYLWMIVGNGFRYGLFYLFLATFLSAIGLTAVYLENPLWSKEPGLYAAFLLAILLHPVYTVSIIRKLRAAIEAANAASRVKSQFLATVSHELRTPLAGVVGIAELLWKSAPTREQRSLLQSLSASAGSLKGLIENILEISRIEAGKSVMEAQPFNLFRLLQESTRTIAPLAFEKKLRFVFRLSGSLPETMTGDERRLQQVLVNLLGNAVKFTEKGQVELSVSGRGTTDNSGWLRFAVEDTGIGIPEEIRPRIFERFVQGEAGVTRKYGGTGLGTSIAKEMVEAMGGTIGFSSQAGKGSRFWFDIPCTVPETGEGAGSTRSPVRILLADFSPEGPGELPARLAGSIDPIVVRNRPDAVAQAAREWEGNAPVEALVVRIGRDLKEWEECLALLRSAPVLEVLPVIFLERDPPLVLPPLPDLWTLPRVYTLLPEDPVLLSSLLLAYPAQTKGPPARERIRERLRLSVLAADDNATNRRFLLEVLKGAGHSVVLASNGEEALDLLEESPDGVFDAMILDYNMPDRGGLDVLKAFRFMNPRSRIATMILTAAVTPEVEESCRRTGVDAFLSKPADSGRLLETLARIVREKGRTAGSPAPGKKTTSPEGERMSPVLDPKVFEKLSRISLNGAFLKDLFLSFRSDGFRLLFEMEEAMRAREHEIFLEKAHALKGGALQMGATRVSEACSRVAGVRLQDMETNRPKFLLFEISDSFREALEALEIRTGEKMAREMEADRPG